MNDPTAIRVALAEKLSPLNSVLAQISPWVLSDPTPPCAYVTLGPEEYHQAFGPAGISNLTYIVFVLIGLTTDIGASKTLSPLMQKAGERSVREILESGDRTLGGLCHSLVVAERSGERVYRLSNPTLGCEWTVNVRA